MTDSAENKPFRILVVDDEPDMGPLITGIFRLPVKRGKLEFVHAENGAKALEVLDEQGDIDLILTDINMPVMDGLTFLNHLKDKGTVAKSVVISAYNDLKNIRTAMNRGAFDFITKPIDPADIKATVEKGIGEMNVVYEGIRVKRQLEQATREKEKLMIEQNERLEIQVKERTATINEQKSLLEIKNKEIVDSIHYAKRLQEAILPPRDLFHDMINDGFILYQSKDIVSGDFYWFGNVDGKKVIVAADCTGHGVAGALMSMMGMSLLNQIVNGDSMTQPSLILDQLDKALSVSMKMAESNAHIGMDVAILVFDETMNHVQYAGANRPLWMVRNGEFLITQPDKSPIGGLDARNQSNFTNHTLDLASSDALYIFTDGFADQFGGSQGKKMMRKRFREQISGFQHLPMNEQGKLLHDYFEEWKGDHEQVDDILVIGIRKDN